MTVSTYEGVDGPVDLPTGHQIFWVRLPDGRVHGSIDLHDVSDEACLVSTANDLKTVLTQLSFAIGKHWCDHPLQVIRWQLNGYPGRIERAQA